MPPKRPMAASKRVKIRDITAEPDSTLSTKVLAIKTPTPVDSNSLEEGVKRAIKHVDECLEAIEGYELGGVTVRTVREAVLETTPAWDAEFVFEIMRYIVDTVSPSVHNTSGRLTQETFIGYINYVLAASHQCAWNPISSKERKKVRFEAVNMIKEYELTAIGYDRAQIGYGTLNALLAGVATEGLGWLRSMRHLLFQSLSTHTGVRPSQLVRNASLAALAKPTYSRARDGNDGARLRDFYLWISRETPSSGPRISGWYRPVGGKTVNARGVSHPLSPVDVLGYSPAALLLIYIGHCGVFSKEEMDDILRRRVGRIKFPSEHLDMPIFPPELGTVHNTFSFSILVSIRRICDRQGIDGIIDTRCYRGLMAASVYEKHGHERAKVSMTHGETGQVGPTRRYIGKASPIDLQQMLFGDEPTALTAMDVNRAAARPNHDLPRQVNPDRLLKIFESKELTEIKFKQEAVKLQLCDRPDDNTLKHTYNKLSVQWRHKLTQALRNGLKIEKKNTTSNLSNGTIVKTTLSEDVLTLERYLLSEADIASRPAYALVDTSVIVVPQESDEQEMLTALFGHPDKIADVYELFGPDGVFSKRKAPVNSIRSAKKAMRAVSEDNVDSEDSEDGDIDG